MVGGRDAHQDDGQFGDNHAQGLLGMMGDPNVQLLGINAGEAVLECTGTAEGRRAGHGSTAPAKGMTTGLSGTPAAGSRYQQASP